MRTTNMKKGNPKRATNPSREKDNNAENINNNKRDASQEPATDTPAGKKSKTTNDNDNDNNNDGHEEEAMETEEEEKEEEEKRIVQEQQQQSLTFMTTNENDHTPANRSNNDATTTTTITMQVISTVAQSASTTTTSATNTVEKASNTLSLNDTTPQQPPLPLHKTTTTVEDTVTSAESAITAGSAIMKNNTEIQTATNNNDNNIVQAPPHNYPTTGVYDDTTAQPTTTVTDAQPAITTTAQPSATTTVTATRRNNRKTATDNDTNTSKSQQQQQRPPTSNTTNESDNTTVQPAATTTITNATKKNNGRSKSNNDTNTPQEQQQPHNSTTKKQKDSTTSNSNVDTTTTTTTTTPATSTKKTSSKRKIIRSPPMKKDKHIAGSSGMRIITPDPQSRVKKSKSDHTFPLTPPASASASISEESSAEPVEDEQVEYLKGYSDEEWFSLMGWHFSENNDHDFVDKHGKLFNCEDYFDRFEFVQAKIQSLVYDRLRDNYGFDRIAVARNKGTSAPGGGDKHRFPQIFVSPDARNNATILVLVPKVGDEVPGQWDKDLFTAGEKGNFMFASQFPYIDMALDQGWGVVLCDPNGGDLHDSDEYWESHIQYVWDDIVQPSQATCVMYVAFGEGTDAVFSILDGSRAAEFRERVKAVVLLDGTTGDKRKDKLDRAWLNRHARSFMAKNGASPGRNGTTVKAAEEHELVPGFAVQAVFAFLRSQHSLFLKSRSSAQSVKKGSITTTNTSSIKKSDSDSRDVRHDRRMMRLQNQKANNISNKIISAMNNNTAGASRPVPSGESRRGRGRPRKLG